MVAWKRIEAIEMGAQRGRGISIVGWMEGRKEKRVNKWRGSIRPAVPVSNRCRASGNYARDSSKLRLQ